MPSEVIEAWVPYVFWSDAEGSQALFAILYLVQPASGGRQSEAVDSTTLQLGVSLSIILKFNRYFPSWVVSESRTILSLKQRKFAPTYGAMPEPLQSKNEEVTSDFLIICPKLLNSYLLSLYH